MRRKVYVIPHSHVDLEWYWTHEEGERRLSVILDSALEIMRGTNEFTFAQDQMALVQAAMAILPPKITERLKKAVDEGRLELVGGMWVQPEVQVPHPEVLIRNIQKGQRWMQASFGRLSECGWNIDTFGQIPQLPQILSKSGYHSFAFWRGVPEQVGRNLPSLFYWESPDGSKILTHWLSRGYTFPFLDVVLPRSTALSRKLFYRYRMAQANVESSPEPTMSDESLAKIEAWLSDLCSRSPVHPVLLPLGGDNAVFDDDVPARIDFLNQKLKTFELVFSTPTRFFEAVLWDPAKDRIQTCSQDFCLPLAEGDLRGTWEGRCELKKAQRETENSLLTAEKLATIASILGAPYPWTRLNVAWDACVLNSFHDIIGGSHTDDVYREAMRRCGRLRETGEINEIATLVKSHAMQGITGIRQMHDGDVLAVFNPLPWVRSSFQKINLGEGFSLMSVDGAPVLSQSTDEENVAVYAFRDVPAFGYRLYEARSGRRSASASGNGREADPGNRLRAGPGFLENQAWKIRFDQSSGLIGGLLFKEACRELMGEGETANEIIVQSHDGDLEGTLNLGEVIWRSGERESSVESVAIGPLFARLRSQGGDDAYRYLSDTILYRDSCRIDFELTIEVVRPNAFIRARFPLAGKPSRIIYDTPYLARERPEGHFAAQNWVACEFGEWGVSLINTGNPGHWIDGRNLDLVLLWSVDQKRPPKWYNAPLAQEIGSHFFRYSLYGYTGHWQQSGVVAEALQANCPLELLRGTPDRERPLPSEKSFLRVQPSTFLVTVLRAADTEELLLIRGYEAIGVPVSVTIELPVRVVRAWKADLLERPLKEIRVDGQTIEFPCGPWEIATILAKPER